MIGIFLEKAIFFNVLKVVYPIKYLLKCSFENYVTELSFTDKSYNICLKLKEMVRNVL